MRTQMTFKEAVVRFCKGFLTLSGRSRRSEFWYGLLFINLAGILLALVNLTVLSAMILLSRPLTLATLLPLLVLDFAIGLVAWLAKITCCVRRLHDIGRSGWWIWILFIPYMMMLTLILLVAFLDQASHGVLFEEGSPLTLVSIISILAIALVCLASTILLTVFLLRPGTEGPNRYGADPTTT